ncbi:MAG TPA: DEAD/DEAH box helicase family protein, partial [Dehalococcoidia bacterium]|nr:DEAD/DEAH box helicase family protein [Dehalococcoidia bacterium]
MSLFRIESDLKPTGDQPQAIAKLVKGLEAGHKQQTLLGVTGSGKTFTMANVIEQMQRPTLVMCHNKTLAAQLCAEFKEYLPHNAVEYFVSYYDYYQPEAYLPTTDTYIEKETDINEEIDKLRHAATRALFERRDAVIVASVSCIYGLGSPEEYYSFVERLKRGEKHNRNRVARRLVEMQYQRNDIDFTRGRFRIRGDVLEVQPAYEEKAVRIEFFGDVIERIVEVDTLTGELLQEHDEINIYPAKHFVTSEEKLTQAMADIRVELEQRLQELRGRSKVLEAARLESRTNYDLEMLQEMGYCTGVENYSR